MLTHKKHKPSCKIWIEYQGKPVLGKGGAQILEQIQREESISKAAEKLDMSYRYVWSYLQRIEKTFGEPVVKTYRGGKLGGGGAKLTRLGKSLLDEYRRLEGYLGELLFDEEYWEAVGLKISARNRLKGIVKNVEKGDIVSKVKIEVKTPVTVTALISTVAVEDLDIKNGDNVEAIVKATEVMIAKER